MGDWGSPENIPQEIILASTMNKVADQFNTSFVIAVGDNFYDDGVNSVDDPKWTSLWTDIYTSTLGQLPWLTLMGNHDWKGNPDAQIEYSKIHPRWQMPDYFYEKVISVGEATVAFIFVDTNLFQYGYDHKYYAKKFADRGWSKQNKTIERQLSWIESKLVLHQDKDYIFVVGHHNLNVCDIADGMLPLDDLLMKYKPTAYIFGHKHTLRHSERGSTMFILSGAAGLGDEECDETQGPGWAMNPKGLGFVHARITPAAFMIDYTSIAGNILYSASASPKRKQLPSIPVYRKAD